MLELVAARLIAPSLGVSLYTWTSVIGVVLGGVSLGNYLGGRLADRRPALSTLAFVYLAGSGASLLVLALLPELGSLELPRSVPALVQVLWVTGLLFLLPSVVLGAPTPLLTRLSLDSVAHTGRVVGRIQAGAALGSVVGVFLTGFFLITWFGTRHIVAGVAGVLLLLAVLARLPRRLLLAAPLAAVAIVAAGWASPSPCTRESAYYCIRVEPGKISFESNGRRVVAEPAQQTLYLDHLVHAIADLADPTDLIYNYEVLYARVLERLHPPGSRIDTFFAGGGGYVFPRFVEATYRGPITVAEIDPAVTEISREYLGLRSSPRLTIRSEDARLALSSLPASARYDAIFGDAFDDFEVPFHLTTREFDALVSRHLRPGGIYLANVIDGVHYDFLRSELVTLRKVFPYVRVVRLAGHWPPRGGRDTFVLVAANAAPARPLPVVSKASLERFLAAGHAGVLTDDHAPVDQLLAPVFRQSLKLR